MFRNTNTIYMYDDSHVRKQCLKICNQSHVSLNGHTTLILGITLESLNYNTSNNTNNVFI